MKDSPVHILHYTSWCGILEHIYRIHIVRHQLQNTYNAISLTVDVSYLSISFLNSALLSALNFLHVKEDVQCDRTDNIINQSKISK